MKPPEVVIDFSIIVKLQKLLDEGTINEEDVRSKNIDVTATYFQGAIIYQIILSE